MEDVRLFDLNIEKILEAWDNSHAVRELIANAIDEQSLTNTPDIEITKFADSWKIRDYGRGLRYEHFTQNENQEKLAATGRVIGKFGVGLKDALATLDRNGVQVEIETRHAIITLRKRTKYEFQDVITLHAAVSRPKDVEFVGTEIRLRGLPDIDMANAKGFFLKFSDESVLEETKLGQILDNRRNTGRIYIVGLLVAQEQSFLFSYNITSLTEVMKKALNRERTNVGRSAYSDRVKAMLLQSKSKTVASMLANQLKHIELGDAADEIHWKDVAVHACKILNVEGNSVFVTANQLSLNASSVDHARSDGHEIVIVPAAIYGELADQKDISGQLIRDLNIYQQQWNNSFSFNWVSADDMTPDERHVFEQKRRICEIAGGLPAHVKEIRISKTMRPDFVTGNDALGLWDGGTSSIVIRRDQLSSIKAFGSVLLHEIAHARSGFDDVTRGFEDALTDLLGLIASVALTETASEKRSFWKKFS